MMCLPYMLQCTPKTPRCLRLCCGAGNIVVALAAAVKELNRHAFRRASTASPALLLAACTTCVRLARLMELLWHDLHRPVSGSCVVLLVLCALLATIAAGTRCNA